MPTIGNCSTGDALMSGSKLSLACVDHPVNVTQGESFDVTTHLWRSANIVLPANPGYCADLGQQGRRARAVLRVDGVDGHASAEGCIWTIGGTQWFDLSLDIPSDIPEGEYEWSIRYEQPESGEPGYADPLFDDTPPEGNVQSTIYGSVYVQPSDPGGVNNDSPVANVSVTLAEGVINANSTGSHDPDGSIVSYEWELVNSQGTVIRTSGRQNTSWDTDTLDAGEYTVRLAVEDNNGAVDVAEETVTISDGSDGSNGGQNPSDPSGSGSPPYALAALAGGWLYANRGDD